MKLSDIIPGTIDTTLSYVIHDKLESLGYSCSQYEANGNSECYTYTKHLDNHGYNNIFIKIKDNEIESITGVNVFLQMDLDKLIGEWMKYEKPN